MIQVLNRGLNILELLSSDANRDFSLHEIATALELDKGTCSNILKTLRFRGYVTQSAPRKGYKMGYMVYRLGDSFASNEGLARLSVDTVNRLAARFNETVLLTTIRQDKRVTLYRAEADQDLIVRSSLEVPAYRASTGRMILSYYSSEELLRFVRLHGTPKEGDWEGITDFPTLHAELERARKRGWRVDCNRQHVVGLAVPVWKGNKVVAALGIYLPESRFNEPLQAEMVNALKEAAETLRAIFNRPE